MSESRQRRRATGDDGAAVVEMALVGTLLFMLLFAIIAYAMLMSFRQNMTQAAAEGARAGALAVPGNEYADAIDAVNEAASGFMGQTDCNGADGLDCAVVIGPCANNTTKSCVTVTITYDNAAHPRPGSTLPLFGAFVPDTLETSSTAEINS